MTPANVFFWIAGCVGISLIETWLVLRVLELSGPNGVFAFVLAGLILKPILDGIIKGITQGR